MAERDLADLEAALRDLGRHLDLPEPGDYCAALLARVETPPGVPSASRRRSPQDPWWQVVSARRRRIRRVAVAVVLVGCGALAVSPAGQAAVARAVHVAGVVLRLGAVDAPRRPERLPDQTSTPLSAARSLASFPIVVPGGLGAPDDITVADSGRVVSLIYRAAVGRPEPGPGGIAARLDEFAGALDIAFVKHIGSGTEIDYVDLGGDAFAIWIPAPHGVEYIDAAGAPHTESAHLAERTLIWQVGTVSYRLEGRFTREQALTVARSTLPPGSSYPK